MKTKKIGLIRKISAYPLIATTLLTTTSALAWTEVQPGLTRPKEGTVIDAHTGKPIANAWVVVRWLYGGFQWLVEHSGGGGCIDNVIVRTDENGVYHIPDMSKEVEVQRSWSLFRHDRFSWKLVVIVPGYITSTDIPKWLGTQKDKYTKQEMEWLSDGVFPEKWEHPKVLSGDGWFDSKQILAPVKMEKSKLPPLAEVRYLSKFVGVESATECGEKPVDPALSRALYERAYQIACVNNPDYTGAEWIDYLWGYTTPPSEEKKRRREEIGKINERGRAQRDNNHDFILTLADRKSMCELTTLIEGDTP